MDSKLNVSEIFYSIQGESGFAGFPCVFIRLSGCNLRCNYCDADYTWEDGEEQTESSILSAVAQYPCSLVELTGGEPLLQEGSIQLLEKLLAAGKTVLVETNGSIAINSLPENCVAIVDVKCPDSGSGQSFHRDNIRHIRQRLADSPGSCELKFVISSEKDYHWAKAFCMDHDLLNLLPVHFSPVQDRVAPAKLAEWIINDGLHVRLQLQLHTILWPGISRGV